LENGKMLLLFLRSFFVSFVVALFSILKWLLLLLLVFV